MVIVLKGELAAVLRSCFSVMMPAPNIYELLQYVDSCLTVMSVAVQFVHFLPLFFKETVSVSFIT